MAHYKELETEEAFKEAWEASDEKPVLLFKHSTTCPISAAAHDEYQAFLNSHADQVDPYLVKVIESKQLSNQIAEDTGVKHESPQIMLIRNKNIVWHTSHSDITNDSINQALQQN